jgi:uncharacterized repeat protein (TIGR03803 family)
MNTTHAQKPFTCSSAASMRSRVLPALLVVLGFILTGPVTAQTFTTLHTFTASVSGIFNSDGAHPEAGLLLSGNTLYGTAAAGGTNGSGTVFALNTNGSNFMTLHQFTGDSDGQLPCAGLILSGNTLYGTVEWGGTYGAGTVFALNTNGTVFAVLYSFTPFIVSSTNRDGAQPCADLILAGNTLYGTANAGGTIGYGTVFALNTNGNCTALHTFTAVSGSNVYTNSDGCNPFAGLILSGNTLYGTARVGGTNGNGTVFAVSTTGGGFSVLHTFTASVSGINSDGVEPYAGLILSGNTLYGTTPGGGTNGNGTVFAVSTTGGGFSVLHTFTASVSGINSDGAEPYAGLILSGNTLYGTAELGGTNGNGTVFALSTTGTNFTTLHTFTAVSGNNYTNSDGAYPSAGLILSGNILYGTALQGGTNGNGTVFSLSLVAVSAPQLTIKPSGTNVILTWPTNATGFTLESTTNLNPPAVWITNSPTPVVVNTNNIVTNGITGTKKFYRLSQ